MRDEVIELYLDDIIPNRFQPREIFDNEALQELSASIKEHGVIQPIIVRKIGEKYEIIAGERRYKASALAGLTKIPAIIRNLDDKEASKVALLENLQRKDLTAIEEARTYQKILELDSMTQEELGKTMGKSQAAIANKIRLLSLTDEVQEALLNDEISERHARSLLNIENGNKQIEMLNRIIRERMTVRELDNEIKKLKEGNQVSMDFGNNLFEQKPTYDNLSPVDNKISIEKTESNEISVNSDPFDINNIIPNYEQNAINHINLTNMEIENNVSKELENINPINDISVEENIVSNVDSINLQTPTMTNNIETLEEEPIISKNEEQLFEQPVVSDIKNPLESGIDNINYKTPVNDNQSFIDSFKYQDAVNLVKNIIPEIKNKGINADIQEFDLDGKYQIVINIDKNK